MDVIEALDREEVAARRGMARRLALVDELDRRKLWREDGATSTSAWLCARYGVTRGSAREQVRVARALRGLPVIRCAHAEGLLSWDQLRPLVRFVAEDEDAASARRAQGMSPAELWREEARRKEVLPEQAEDDRELRRVHLSWDEERRFLELWGMLPAEQGAAIEEALRRRAEDVVLEDGPLYDRAGARLADALEELATSEGGRPAPASLVVHADAEVLAGAGGLAETENGIRLTGEAIRRLACDARIEWVLESGGRPVGIGRRSRAVPGWLSRLLRHRDRGCRFPGCERRSWLKAHHLWHWAHGGPTDLDNLVLVCHAHHRLVHEGGWTVTGHPAGRLGFHRPDGRPLRRLAPSIRAGP